MQTPNEMSRRVEIRDDLFSLVDFFALVQKIVSQMKVTVHYQVITVLCVIILCVNKFKTKKTESMVLLE